MAIYEPTFTGLKLSDTEFDDLSLTSDDLCGYFSKDELDPILQQADCIGIRLYNLRDTDHGTSLVVVAVNADGFDLPHSIQLRSQFASEPAFGDTMAFSFPRMEASLEFGALKSVGRLEDLFSSFFLKKTIESLLNTSGFSGICFYKSSLEKVPATLLPTTINPKGKLTHVAVTANIDTVNNKIVGIDPNVAFDHAYCDRPCPGHCVNFDSKQNIIVAEEPVQMDPNDLSGPYIPVWQ